MNFASSSGRGPDDVERLLQGLDRRAEREAPKTIGSYRVVRRLGQGGMGVVWEARAPDGRRVALKVLNERPSRTSRQLRRQLINEFRTATRIDHPNVVRIHGLEFCRHLGLFSVMELVQGPTMDIVARSNPDAETRLDLLLQVARGVAAAHAQGIVHRDLKPQNVIVNTHGCPKVTDFGIACMVDAGHAGGLGTAFGTPGYMAPEQARPLRHGSARRRRGALRPRGMKDRLRDAAGDGFQPSTDVYALGVMLHELMIGRRPTVADMKRLVRSSTRPGRVLSDWLPRLVVNLEPVCLKALSTIPVFRHPCAGEFADDVELAMYRADRGIVLDRRPWTRKLRLQRLRKFFT